MVVMGNDMRATSIRAARPDHLLRSVVTWSGAGVICGVWTSAAIHFGDFGWGQGSAVALAFVPVVLVLSLAVVALFVEGGGSAGSSGIAVALGYILLANVAVVVNPLYFFANYGAASTIYQRAAGAVVALPLFSLAFLVAVAFTVRTELRASIRPFEWWIVTFFVGMTLLSFCIGVARSNFAAYVVSDLAKDLVVPAGWIVFRYAMTLLTPWQVVRSVVGFAVLPSFIDIGYHLRDLLLDYPYGRYGGYATLPLAFFVASLILRAKGDGQIGATLGVSAMLTSSLLSFSRLTWLQAAGIVVAGLWKSARTRSGAVPAIVLAVVIVGGAMLGSGMSSFNELLEERFTEAFSFSESEFAGIGGEVAVGGLSGARKLTETYSVLAQFAAGGIGEWVLGFGEGAEFEHLAPSREVREIYEFRGLRIHNIHNIVAAVLFRKGIVGVLILCALFASFWLELQRVGRYRRSRKDQIILWTVKVYFVLSVIKSMSVDVMLWTLEWGALFAIVGSLAHPIGQDSEEL